jgi:hypothetical protein
MWAAIGNVFKISAAFGFVGTTLLAYGLIDASQRGVRKELIPPLAVITVLSYAFCILSWNIKGPLIRGNLLARIVFGGWTLLGVIFSFGFSLIWLGIVYLFTSEPAAYDYYGMFGSRDKEPPPRFKAPNEWQATGHVGPSGATLYEGPGSEESSAGIFDSWTPVQVVEKQNGFAQVVAATGQRGWIDVRTLTEGG